MRWLTAGESHGQALVGIIEGLPAGIPCTTESIASDLARRRLGYGRGARQKFEADDLTIMGGIRHGLTQGGPVALVIRNSEWPKWEKVMSADPVPHDEIENLARNAPLTRPRPGHADLAGMQKYSFTDSRPVLERASARETATRVALGSVARSFLKELGIEIISHVTAIGKAVSESSALLTPHDQVRIDESPVRASDKAAESRMIAEIEEAQKSGDTLGGTVEILVFGAPPGLGSHVHWDRRLDSRLAAALMGIQAIKGVGIGDGFTSASRRGSEAHDEIEMQDGKLRRRTSRAGGIEGGMSTGEVIRATIAMKPISTVPKALDTVDVSSKESAKANNQRSDVCAVPAAGIVAEAMVALVISEAVLEKFGGDHINETKRNVVSFLENLEIK